MFIPVTFVTKYKPVDIHDFQLSDDFMSVLNAMFEMDDLNLLFVGEPNTGKTSFLYAVIRHYYDGQIPEKNIMFINNLKEQGVHFFRNEMKTFCRSHSSIHCKKKLIVVDDMDTLNDQCQQVFRNYIDKYKRNVNFIFTCSNTQKVIESIQSRVHVLRIHSLSEHQIASIMDKIVLDESIHIDEDTKKYVLRISENTVRNVITNLEKIYLYGLGSSENVSVETCKLICSNVSTQQFETYIQAFSSGLREPIRLFYAMHDYGYSVIDILHYFFIFVKSTESLSEDQKYQLMPVICKYITIFHKIHENAIELALFTNDISAIIQGARNLRFPATLP
jgi:DNA polymerase III delta prime subunit